MSACSRIFQFGRPTLDLPALRVVGGCDPYAHYKGGTVEFWANADLLSRSDFPQANAGPRVLSRRIVEVLCESGVERTSFLAVTVHLSTQWKGAQPAPWADEDTPPLQPHLVDCTLHEYFAVVKAAVVDCVDWSVATEQVGRLVRPWETGVVQPRGGFPPLFIIERGMGPPFWVTDHVMERLQSAGVLGLDLSNFAVVRE